MDSRRLENMTRWDWGQDLFEWFEYYLQERGPKPSLDAQIQRNDGQWRIEETWPPADREPFTLDLSDCGNDGAFVGGGPSVVGGGQTVTVECPDINEDRDIHIAGLPTLHLSAVPTFDGGPGVHRDAGRHDRIALGACDHGCEISRGRL